MTATAQTGHRLRLAPARREQLERDLEEMRRSLQALEQASQLTRGDIIRMESKIDKILKVVLAWKRSPSAPA